MINNYILKSIIYGGIDGIITMFNIAAGITGAKLKTKYIFILGLAVLISDGLSMGIGDYLSLHADIKRKEINEKENLVKDVKPLNNAMITFLSFIFFGFIPIIVYSMINGSQKSKFIKLFVSIIISLTILGTLQSKYTDEKWYISSAKLTLFGSLTSLVSYNISKIIMKNI
jgi:vacuolar iron transporter family protein